MDKNRKHTHIYTRAHTYKVAPLNAMSHLQEVKSKQFHSHTHAHTSTLMQNRSACNSHNWMVIVSNARKTTPFLAVGFATLLRVVLVCIQMLTFLSVSVWKWVVWSSVYICVWVLYVFWKSSICTQYGASY